MTGTPLPLLPRSLYFGNAERASPAISPDGRLLGFLAPDGGVMNVFVGPADDPAAARPVTSDRLRGIRAWAWAKDGEHLLYVQDEGGDENWHVHAVAVATGASRDLTPFPGISASIEKLSSARPHEVVVAVNDRDPQWHDRWIVNLRTGERTLLAKNDRFVSALVDEQFRIVATASPRADGGRIFHRRGPSGALEPWMEVGLADATSTGLSGVTRDGSTIYILDARGRDTEALFAVDAASGATTLLAEHPGADPAAFIDDPRTDRIAAVAFDGLRREWRALDPAIGADLAALAGVRDGEIHVLSQTDDDSVWTVAFVVDDGPVAYYRYERASRRATYLFSARPALEGMRHAKMRALFVTSRDGLRLPTYVTLPAGTPCDAPFDATARPVAPLPTVLWVHGGPWARDSWGWNPHHQWLSNRGYAVISVNYRGSTGFGKSFTNAGDGEWAGKMHDDLLDVVEWAIAEGIADRAKVAIGGGSYGGYATLVGLTFTPDVFACGVDIVGPSSIVTLIRSVPPYWLPLITTFTKRVGDPSTPEGLAFLESRSPLHKVGEIRRPLLIAQGANDPRVKQAESDQIVAEMERRKIPVTYVLFPDEGHGFARPENSLAFHAAMEAFLAQHLGGRAEPVGTAFDASTIRIVTGREHVAGL